MLSSRIIPVLLLHKKGLVKTINFKVDQYVGDPLNAVKIFNEQESDELIILDIDASIEGREPDYKLIERIALECRMPLCYGGGIKTVHQAERILNLGVEKVCLSSVAFDQPEMITELASRVGRQSVVVCIDVKKRRFSKKYDCFTLNATRRQSIDAVSFSMIAQRLGAGEIVINSIDNDGVMKGYDLEIVNKIKTSVNLPVTVIGGAGSHDDIKSLIAQETLIGAAAGSLFVFKGRYKAVLINYPTPLEKQRMLDFSH